MAGVAAREPTAVLVASAWEAGAPPEVAARITYTVDVTRPESVTVAATGADEIVAVVRRWLEEVSAGWESGDVAVTEE
jgi:hypothetical protein